MIIYKKNIKTTQKERTYIYNRKLKTKGRTNTRKKTKENIQKIKKKYF